jgi:hypothetical protein
MAIRNFWVEALIDGRKTKLAGGPRSKHGGFSLTVFQRSQGGITRALIVDGFANENGELNLSVRNGDDTQKLRITTER